MKQFRDVHNGQFGFDGQWDRLCVCGHRLGVHGCAGVECLAGTNVPDDPNPRGVECLCTKFKPLKMDLSPKQIEWLRDTRPYFSLYRDRTAAALIRRGFIEVTEQDFTGSGRVGYKITATGQAALDLL